MSLILEALRKSEAERRRGASPDVAMELPPVAAARTDPRSRWRWPAIACGALLALACGWWLQRGPAPPASPAREHAVQAQAATPAPVVIARPRPQPAPPPAATTMDTPALPPASAPPAAATVAAPAPALPAPPRIEAPVPAPVAATAGDDVPDIDATALPPVRLSMHIWDAARSKRFVILDGQRMGEGDRIGGLQVIAIHRDGVIVERDGQRARVPLP